MGQILNKFFMPDHFTEVTTTGYGKRVGNAFGGIIIGIVLFFASFYVLYTNEGSVDMSVIAKTAVQVDSSKEVTDAALSGKLLATSGVLNSEETLGDDLYLKPDKYIALDREVEMYSWVEKKTEHRTTNTGGSETTTTDYDYVKEWTSNPESSSGFRYPEGHQNPTLDLKGTEKRVSNATVGIFGVEMGSVTLPSLTKITLNAENTLLATANATIEPIPPVMSPSVAAPTPAASAPANPVTTPAVGAPAPAQQPVNSAPTLAGGEYIYLNKYAGGSYQMPAVGDVRVSYNTLKSGANVTIFGKLNGKTFGSYLDPDNNRLFQIFAGTREDAIASLHQSYVMWIWIWRLIGFVMMWAGLGSVLAPLNVILDFLPMLGGLSRSLTGAITFVAALVLSAVTILISMIFHSLIAVVVAVVAALAIGFMIMQQKKSASSGVKLPPIEPPAAPGNTPPAGNAPPA